MVKVRKSKGFSRSLEKETEKMAPIKRMPICHAPLTYLKKDHSTTMFTRWCTKGVDSWWICRDNLTINPSVPRSLFQTNEAPEGTVNFYT